MKQEAEKEKHSEQKRSIDQKRQPNELAGTIRHLLVAVETETNSGLKGRRKCQGENKNELP